MAKSRYTGNRSSSLNISYALTTINSVGKSTSSTTKPSPQVKQMQSPSVPQSVKPTPRPAPAPATPAAAAPARPAAATPAPQAAPHHAPNEPLRLSSPNDVRRWRHGHPRHHRRHSRRFCHWPRCRRRHLPLPLRRQERERPSTRRGRRATRQLAPLASPPLTPPSPRVLSTRVPVRVWRVPAVPVGEQQRHDGVPVVLRHAQAVPAHLVSSPRHPPHHLFRCTFNRTLPVLTLFYSRTHSHTSS
jgi:hypothetical protein